MKSRGFNQDLCIFGFYRECHRLFKWCFSNSFNVLAKVWGDPHLDQVNQFCNFGPVHSLIRKRSKRGTLVQKSSCNAVLQGRFSLKSIGRPRVNQSSGVHVTHIACDFFDVVELELMLFL